MAEHFDVCVLGGQPAGFLLAALLAKRKLRTILIDHGEGFDQYKQGGVVYPLLPQPLMVKEMSARAPNTTSDLFFIGAAFKRPG